MTLYDPELAEIIRKGTPVEIQNRQFIIQPSRSGKCDGCYFQNQLRCPTKAVTYCTSNGGNILKIKE